MIFRGYLTTAEICTIHALNQVASKDHPQHYMHGMSPRGPSMVRGNYIWQPYLVQGPGTISGITVYRNKTPIFLLLKVRICYIQVKGIMYCIKTCSILATKVVFERKVYHIELYGYIYTVHIPIDSKECMLSMYHLYDSGD